MKKSLLISVLLLILLVGCGVRSTLDQQAALLGGAAGPAPGSPTVGGMAWTMSPVLDGDGLLREIRYEAELDSGEAGFRQAKNVYTALRRAYGEELPAYARYRSLGAADSLQPSTLYGARWEAFTAGDPYTLTMTVRTLHDALYMTLVLSRHAVRPVSPLDAQSALLGREQSVAAQALGIETPAGMLPVDTQSSIIIADVELTESVYFSTTKYKDGLPGRDPLTVAPYVQIVRYTAVLRADEAGAAQALAVLDALRAAYGEPETEDADLIPSLQALADEDWTAPISAYADRWPLAGETGPLTLFLRANHDPQQGILLTVTLVTVQ